MTKANPNLPVESKPEDNLVFKIGPEEQWLLQSLSDTFIGLTRQTNQAKDGLNSYIALIEGKYCATFDPIQGVFVPKIEEEPPAEDEGELEPEAEGG